MRGVVTGVLARRGHPRRACAHARASSGRALAYVLPARSGKGGGGGGSGSRILLPRSGESRGRRKGGRGGGERREVVVFEEEKEARGEEEDEELSGQGVAHCYSLQISQ